VSVYLGNHALRFQALGRNAFLRGRRATAESVAYASLLLLAHCDSEFRYTIGDVTAGQEESAFQRLERDRRDVSR
jgi:hypothetical protein